MKAVMQEMRPDKQGVLRFIKFNYKILKSNIMSTNFQLNPRSYKTVLFFTICLIIAFQIFK